MIRGSDPKTINIIGCGESAKLWDGTGLSIGVNDCEKHLPVDFLVIVNAPQLFRSEPDRMEVMKKTKARVITNMPEEWGRYFQKVHEIKDHEFRRWSGSFKNGNSTTYFAETSPFVAMSVAYNMGASEIRLYGVDFNSHKMFKPGIPGLDAEVQRYLSFSSEVRKKGCEVRVTRQSFLSKFMEVIEC